MVTSDSEIQILIEGDENGDIPDTLRTKFQNLDLLFDYCHTGGYNPLL